MLPVPIHLHGDVVALLERIPVTGLHRAPDPEVERKPDHVGTAICCDPRRAVGRTVVDHSNLEARVERADLVDHAADRGLLVERRNDREALQLLELGEQAVLRHPEFLGSELGHRRSIATAPDLAASTRSPRDRRIR